MNVLIIAPHPDDEVIGCGGAVRLRAQSGDRVSAAFLTSGELGLRHLPREKAWKLREAEVRKAAKVLGLKELYFLRQPDWVLGQHAATAAKVLVPALQSEKPEVIYLPHPLDGHPDHQATLGILRAALKRCRGLKPDLLGYEVWSPMTSPTIAVDISKVMQLKLRALRMHRSQLDDFDYVRAVTGLNQFRGELVGKCRFAEVFQGLSLD